jgi:hypothetical protein
MSKDKYVDPTIADHPPGGKVHKVEGGRDADRLPPEEPAGSDAKRDGKTATAPKTVANTKK